MSARSMIVSAGIGGRSDASDPVVAKRIIELSEAAGIDLLQIGEVTQDGAAPAFDPLVIAGWLAPRARHVGLVPLVPVPSSEPFHVARALSALDFLTGGKSGWQPASGGSEVARAVDFVAATESLWDSWDDDAMIINQASGVYLDPGKVRRNDYRGPFFKVLGALNAARPPQGYPILVQSDEDPLAAATKADILIVDLDSEPGGSGALRLARVAAAALDLAMIDRIERRFRDGAIDGIHLQVGDPVADLVGFAEIVAPLLRSHRLTSQADPGLSLRARLGLAVPTNPFQRVPA